MTFPLRIKSARIAQPFRFHPEPGRCHHICQSVPVHIYRRIDKIPAVAFSFLVHLALDCADLVSFKIRCKIDPRQRNDIQQPVIIEIGNIQYLAPVAADFMRNKSGGGKRSQRGKTANTKHKN